MRDHHHGQIISPEINQSALNEKRALTAGCQGSYRSPKRESIGVSYAKHTTRYNELTEPVRGLRVDIIATTWVNKPMRRNPGEATFGAERKSPVAGKGPGFSALMLSARWGRGPDANALATLSFREDGASPRSLGLMGC